MCEEESVILIVSDISLEIGEASTRRRVMGMDCAFCSVSLTTIKIPVFVEINDKSKFFFLPSPVRSIKYGKDFRTKMEE
jgi:hypothetical protein